MGRRIAIVGAVLIAVGVLVQIWLAPIVWGVFEAGPLAGLVRGALPVVAALGFLGATTGAVMLAVSLMVQLTGQPQTIRPAPTMLWTGIGVSVLWMGLDLFILQNAGFYETVQDVSVRLLMAGSAMVSVLHVIGAAALALWLVSLLTSRHAAPRKSSRNAAMAPSRPF